MSFRYHVKTQQVSLDNARRIIKQWNIGRANLDAVDSINDNATCSLTSFEKYFEPDMTGGIFAPYHLIFYDIPSAIVDSELLGGKAKKINALRFVDKANFFSISKSSKANAAHVFHVAISDITKVEMQPFSGNFVGYKISLHRSKQNRVELYLGSEMASVEFFDALRRAIITQELSNISRAAVERAAYDCFISYATEDRVSVALPLATHLRDRGLSVWFDQFSLTIGDSIRRKVDEGLSQSLFGIVILSKHFFAKNWTRYELDGLVSREMASGDNVILPIWHRLNSEDVQKYSSALAGKLALDTTEMEIEDIAVEIEKVVSDRKNEINKESNS